MENRIRWVLFLALSVDNYCQPFSAEQNALVLEYCTEIAAKIGLPRAHFKIDDDRSYHLGPFQDAAGYYDPLHNYVSLSPWTKERLLESKKNNLSGSSSLDLETISDGQFVLLHELGHYHNQSAAACTSMLTFGSLCFAEHALRLDHGKISVMSKLALLGINLFLSKYLSEGYADRFAAKQLCQLYGFTKTQDFFADAMKYSSIRGLALDSKLDGYYSYKKLLNYSKKLEKWSKNSIPSSFYVNNSI